MNDDKNMNKPEVNKDKPVKPAQGEAPKRTAPRRPAPEGARRPAEGAQRPARRPAEGAPRPAAPSSAATQNRAKMASRSLTPEAPLIKAAKTRKKKKSGKGFNLRRFQYGSISVGLVIMFIAAIVMLNVGVQYLTDRYYLKLDITSTNYYEISETTKSLLANMDEDVTVYILLSENDVVSSTYYNIAYEFLQRYRALSNGKIDIEFVDIYKNPTFINAYKDATEEITSGSFIVQSSLRYKILKLADLYTLSTVQTSDEYDFTQYVSGVDADQNLVTAIQYVTAKDLPTVVFITGHEEAYGKDYAKLFTNNNYYYEECNLVLDDIPADAEIVVLGMPMFDYTEEQTEKLDRYLTRNSGTVVMFAGIIEKETPVIDAWLEEWGIAITDTMVLDGDRAMYSEVGIVADITNTDVCKNLEITDSTYLLMPNSVALEMLYESGENKVNSSILSSSDLSYGKDISGGKIVSSYAKTADDSEGPFDLGIVSRYSGIVNGKPVAGTLAVMGSYFMISDNYLEMQSLANRQYLLGMINYLYSGVNTLIIEETNYVSSSMTILESQANVVFWLLIVVLPGIIILMGVYVWLKRRHQ